MNKEFLSKAVEIIVFLFAAFGGFLTDVAPPDQSGVKLIVGAASVVALIVLLIVSAVAKSASGQRYPLRWLAAGVLAAFIAIPALLQYQQALPQYTWWYPDSTQRLRGLDADYTPEVKTFLSSHSDVKDPKMLARNFEPSQMWTDDSIKRVGKRLSLLYMSLILSIAATVFCLVEANASRTSPSGSAADSGGGTAGGSGASG